MTPRHRSTAMHSRLLSRPVVRRVLTAGGLASALSMAVLAGAGRRDTGSALAAINAPSHWIWGEQALRRDDATLQYTLLGAATHVSSAMFWAAAYEGLRAAHRRPTPANAVVDAALLTAAAAVVDLKLVPTRLMPGFEQRLSARNLAWVYVGLAAGLALGEVWASRRHSRRLRDPPHAAQQRQRQRQRQRTRRRMRHAGSSP
jgi:hypothetical protein